MIAENIRSAITFLKTADLESTTRFYTQILGLPQVLDQGTCRIFRLRPGAYLGFCSSEAAPEQPCVILTLVVEDVDGACAELRRAGVPIEVEPRVNERYQIYQCFARDPNGYMLEIQRFLDPAWQAEEQVT
jgi:catechol 2,3-dioxygenase-like lactoylglutathione lyase family enzyme